MNRREFVICTYGAAAAFVTPFGIVGQSKLIEPDLASLADVKGLNASKRTISRLGDGMRKGVRLSEAEGEGPAYLSNVEFANGTLEVDMKGKDVQGGSSVGVAFHGVDGSTYDAVYFRPFNFRTGDQARVVRAVQYISHPAHRGSGSEQSTRTSSRSPSSRCPIRTTGFTFASSLRARRWMSTSPTRRNRA